RCVGSARYEKAGSAVTSRQVRRHSPRPLEERLQGQHDSSIDYDADIPDYGKLIYERQRAAKQQSKAARSKRQPTRELLLRVGIADRDFEAKVVQARTLLAAGANVRVSVEIATGQQRSRARELADRFADAARDAATAVVPPQEGKNEMVV